MRMAVDNLALKMDFLQQMSADEAIAVRLAEAACGSKWKHKHAIHLEAVEKAYPQYSAAPAKIGIKPGMSTEDVTRHVKSNLVCDPKAKKQVLRALEDGDPAAAAKAMGGRQCLTL